MFQRLQGETNEEFIYRVCLHKDQIGTWDDVAALLNELLNQEYTESKYRKQFKGMQKVVEKDRKEQKASAADIDDKIRELERAKIAYRDERNAWQKQNYADARMIETLELLEKELPATGRINFSKHDTPSIDGKTEMIICLSDLHIGQCFSSAFGEYNSDIAEKRLAEYLEKVKETAKRHKIFRAHIVCLGDLISGSIHKTIAITNRENVVQQIKKATELITSFCYECTKIFNYVFLYSVSGNHSRIDKKEIALHGERIDDIVTWAVSLGLSHINNFKYMKHHNLDIGITKMYVANNHYVAVHGDWDAMNKTAISNLTMMLGCVPCGIIRGHNHTPAMGEFNGVRVYQSGGLAGSGDDFTIEQRLMGKPSQTMLVCNKSGVECVYNVDFD